MRSAPWRVLNFWRERRCCGCAVHAAQLNCAGSVTNFDFSTGATASHPAALVAAPIDMKWRTSTGEINCRHWEMSATGRWTVRCERRLLAPAIGDRNLVRNFRGSPRWDLVAVCDRDESRARKVIGPRSTVGAGDLGRDVAEPG